MNKCFVIMPITTPEHLIDKYSGDKDHFMHVLDHLLVPAMKKANLEPVSPIAQGSDVIHGEIIKHIEMTDMVLCDMSSLNPNVFFELGTRTALNKPICLIKDDITLSIPFDTSIINYHTYSSSLSPWLLETEVEALSTHLTKSVDNSKGSNSLWKYFSLSLRAEPIKEQTGVESQIEYLNLQVEALRKQLQNVDRPKRVGADSPEIKVSAFNKVTEAAREMGIEITGGRVEEDLITVGVGKGKVTELRRKALHRLAETIGYRLRIDGIDS